MAFAIGLRDASALALPTESPVPPPSPIGGAPRSPATWSEPHWALNGMLRSRSEAIASAIAWITAGLVVSSPRGVLSGSSAENGTRHGLLGSRSMNSSKMWVPTEVRVERPSHFFSTAHASVSPVAAHTLSRSPSARITSAARSRFSCS